MPVEPVPKPVYPVPNLFLKLGLGGLCLLEAGLDLGVLSCQSIGLLLGLAGLVRRSLAVHLLLLQIFLQSTQPVLNPAFLLCQRSTVERGEGEGEGEGRQRFN